jgi:hypothetical protein
MALSTLEVVMERNRQAIGLLQIGFEEEALALFVHKHYHNATKQTDTMQVRWCTAYAT